MLASGKTVPRGRSTQGNLEGILLRKALGRGWCQKMHREVPFKEKPGKGFRLGSAAAPTNPSAAPVSHVLTGLPPDPTLVAPTLKSKSSSRGWDGRASQHREWAMPFAGSCLLCRHYPLLSPLTGFLLLWAVLPPLPGASRPPRSPLVCVSPAVTGWSKASVGQAVLGRQLRMENRAQEL